MNSAVITWSLPALLLLLFQVGVASSQITPFLVGGTPAVIGQFPAHVGVHIGTTGFCGGAILNANHILTSGSCVLDGQNNLIAPSQFLVRSGVINIDATTPNIQIDRVFVHPHYNPFTFENDIAVLRTTAAMVFPEVGNPHIAPAELQYRIVAENSHCYVAGWNWQQGIATMALQHVPVTVYPRTACNTMYSGTIRDSMICTATANDNQGLCVPNRGGGLYCNDRLTAVASFGFGCAANATATVFTQVRYYEHWIGQQFARNDNPPPGPTPMPGLGGGASSSVTMSMVAILWTSLLIMLLR